MTHFSLKCRKKFMYTVTTEIYVYGSLSDRYEFEKIYYQLNENRKY